MKCILLAAVLGTSAVLAEDASKPGETPPVIFNNSNLKSGEVYVYEQKPVGRPALIAAETAKGVVDRFKDNYSRLGSPRMVVYVNRNFVGDASGAKLAEPTEPVQSETTEVKSEYQADPNASQTGAAIPSASNVTTVGDASDTQNNIPGSGDVNTKTQKSTQEVTDRNPERTASTLSDKQTVRDVERLFGRPLRMAGVTIADQRVASQLLAGRPLENLQTEQARKDREALSKIADIAVDLLISSRQITVPEVSGDKTYAVPDIQATAIRLSDSSIVGQATASDLIGKDQYAGRIVRNFDIGEIAEATALALMEDMLRNIE